MARSTKSRVVSSNVDAGVSHWTAVCKVNGRYIVAGCLKDNDKSRVYMLTDAAAVVHMIDVGHLGYDDAWYAVDRIVLLTDCCLLFVHLNQLATVAVVVDDALTVVRTIDACNDGMLDNMNDCTFDAASGRLLLTSDGKVCDIRLKIN